MAFTGLPPGGGGGPIGADYAGKEHVEFSRDNGKAVLVSYYHPLDGRGELRLVWVIFE